MTIEEVYAGRGPTRRVLGYDDAGTIAPGKLADLAIFDLSHPRYFGLHDPLLGPVAAAGSAHLRYLMVGGRIVVDDGAIPVLIRPRCATRRRASSHVSPP